MNSKSLIASLLMVIAGISTVLLLFGCATTEVSSSNGLIAQAAFTEQFVTECKVRAEAGDINAQAQYGRALLNGWGIKTNYLAAAEWLRKAAEAGNAIGQNGLGVCYESGRGVPKNEAKAVDLYRKAAEQGLALAQCNLGWCYESGTGLEKDERTAVEWYRKAAEQGLARAQCNLGVCYEFGRGISKDEAQAVKWYRKSAEQGFANAQYRLGVCYDCSRGVTENDEKAAEWYRKAADQGFGPAQYNLAWCYNYGTGVTRDMKKAAELYRKAANLGDARAIEWCRKAAKFGYASVISKQKNIASTWTTNDTERFWGSVAENATRITTAPRKQSASEEVGEGTLESFAIQYLPNAYERYQGKRAKAKSLEEEFSKLSPEARKSSDLTTLKPRYGLKEKVIVKKAHELAMAVSMMDRLHDELCHYYLLHKAGIATAFELGHIDASPICIMLPEIEHEGQTHDFEPAGLTLTRNLPTIEGEDRSFAEKSFPWTLAKFDHFAHLYEEGYASLLELERDCEKMDIVRGYGVLTPLKQRLSEIRDAMEDFPQILKSKKLQLRLGEITQDQIAEVDQKLSSVMQHLEKKTNVREYCVNWQKEHWTDRYYERLANRDAPVFFALRNMILIEDDNDRMFEVGKYEVTVALWNRVMGKQYVPESVRETIELREKEITSFRHLSDSGKFPLNWTTSQSSDYPMTGVSQREIYDFLEKFNQLPIVKEWLSLRTDRGWKKIEITPAPRWEYVCTAGDPRAFCSLPDGSKITSKEDLKEVAWIKENSAYVSPIGNNTRAGKHQLIFPFGLKKPNSFGIHDMIGNAGEVSDLYKRSEKVIMGGTSNSDSIYVRYLKSIVINNIFDDGQNPPKADARFSEDGERYTGFRLWFFFYP